MGNPHLILCSIKVPTNMVLKKAWYFYMVLFYYLLLVSSLKNKYGYLLFIL